MILYRLSEDTNEISLFFNIKDVLRFKQKNGD